MFSVNDYKCSSVLKIVMQTKEESGGKGDSKIIKAN